MKKTKLKLIVLLLMITLIIVFTVKAAGINSKNTPKLYFVNTDVFISAYSGENIGFPVIFLADSKLNLKDKIKNVSLVNTDNCEIDKWKINGGRNFKDIRINNIDLTLKMKKPGTNSINGLKIQFKNGITKEIKFNKCMIYVLNMDKEKSLLNASREIYLTTNNTCIFSLKNNLKYPIEMKSLNFISDDISLEKGRYYKSNKECIINDIAEETLNPNETIDFNLSTKDNDNADIYFIRPYMEFIYNNTTFENPVTQGTVYGLPFKNDKMLSLYNQYLQSK